MGWIETTNQNQFVYSPEVSHRTWKSAPGKGDSYWKPSFSGSMLNFGGVTCFAPGFGWRKNSSVLPLSRRSLVGSACGSRNGTVVKNRRKSLTTAPRAEMATQWRSVLKQWHDGTPKKRCNKKVRLVTLLFLFFLRGEVKKDSFQKQIRWLLVQLRENVGFFFQLWLNMTSL